jgi:hypothetical protein
MIQHEIQYYHCRIRLIGLSSSKFPSSDRLEKIC